MSTVTTGSLNIIDYPREGGPLVESWAPGNGGEIGYTITGGDLQTDADGWAHYRWTMRYRRNGKSMQITYRRGTALPGIPDAEEGLRSAFLDARCYFDADSFEDFCDSFGYDADRRAAEKVYKACKRQHERLSAFMGTTENYNRWEIATEAVDA